LNSEVCAPKDKNWEKEFDLWNYFLCLLTPVLQIIRIGHASTGGVQMNYTEFDLIESLLDRTYTSNGKSVEIFIYRMPNTPWSVEVVDQFHNTTVWDDEFEHDQQALDFVLSELERDGIDAFIAAPDGE
jgi:hypothetical protein